MCAEKPCCSRKTVRKTLNGNDHFAAADALLAEVTGGNYSLVESPVLAAA